MQSNEVLTVRTRQYLFVSLLFCYILFFVITLLYLKIRQFLIPTSQAIAKILAHTVGQKIAVIFASC